MSSSEFPAEPTGHAATNSAVTRGLRTIAALRRLIAGEPLSALRELDDFRLRDIGASGDDIWRVHRLRNGERPTLLVG